MNKQFPAQTHSTRLEEMSSNTGKLFLQIELEPGQQWIYANWIGYPTPDNVAKGAFAYLNWMQAKGCTAVLNDNRQLVGRWDQSLDWLENQWIPHALKTGLKHWAHLDNLAAFSASSADQLRERVKGRFEIQLFDDQAAAEEWLRKHQK